MRVIFERNVAIPMRDGVTLRANVYRPETGGPYPVLLTRHPYGKDTALSTSLLDPTAMVEAGYIVVIQDVRGRFASEGDFQSYAQEFEDGYDTVEWAASLPGSDGQVGMFGTSYFGYTQWQAAAMKPPSLKAILPVMTYNDAWYGSAMRGGALEWGKLASWFTNAIALPELLRKKCADKSLPMMVAQLVSFYDQLPMRGMYELPLNRFSIFKELDVLGDLFYEAFDHPGYDAYWQATSIRPHFDAIEIPSFHVGGWYDVFAQPTIDNYLEMKRRGRHARLLMGPWSHTNYSGFVGDVDFGLAASAMLRDLKEDLTGLHRKWFDLTLKNSNAFGLAEEPPVTLFVMGVNRWISTESWPLPDTHFAAFYLREGEDAALKNAILGGGLSLQPPVQKECADSYDYDPADPVLSRGGNLLTHPVYGVGPHDQRAIETRPDVLLYTSDALEEDLAMIGPITAKLYVSSDAVDTDFVVRVCDVHPDGTSINIVEGIQRMRYRVSDHAPSLMTPGEIYEVDVDLWSTAMVFQKGHRLRVHVTSSSFPHWDRNLNTGANNGTTTEMKVARNTVYHTEEHPSHVVLPIVTLA
ncbi:CocE/NonD family hydrolase [Ferroacidibacillus organovorans]|uniref:Xaa-Pro dipeptidyl-peptidase C-terminal domain-containing protein n=1 Tax=Ferroacidibacillus organovorans TaxID=1765683 RepID=A0A101XNH6_9BACL|nr:CocE/NonD family hydrolase [Ferroacidibacillus organovorans]KUO94694.1 hypothetical protein ATW55_02185 [Ferroacidibacillus organovorans]